MKAAQHNRYYGLRATGVIRTSIMQANGIFGACFASITDINAALCLGLSVAWQEDGIRNRPHDGTSYQRKGLVREAAPCI
jgi:hypothetical protein